MISKELKNDFREMIFGTFCAGFEDVIYSWEKNHFLRKWAFPEMDGNHFFPENARQPPKITIKLSQYCLKNITKISYFQTNPSIGKMRKIHDIIIDNG